MFIIFVTLCQVKPPPRTSTAAHTLSRLTVLCALRRDTRLAEVIVRHLQGVTVASASLYYPGWVHAGTVTLRRLLAQDAANESEQHRLCLPAALYQCQCYDELVTYLAMAAAGSACLAEITTPLPPVDNYHDDDGYSYQPAPLIATLLADATYLRYSTSALHHHYQALALLHLADFSGALSAFNRAMPLLQLQANGATPTFAMQTLLAPAHAVLVQPGEVRTGVIRDSKAAYSLVVPLDRCARPPTANWLRKVCRSQGSMPRPSCFTLRWRCRWRTLTRA